MSTLRIGDVWPLGNGLVGGLLLDGNNRIWFDDCAGITIVGRSTHCGSEGKPTINILDILNEGVL